MGKTRGVTCEAVACETTGVASAKTCGVPAAETAAVTSSAALSPQGYGKE